MMGGEKVAPGTWGGGKATGETEVRLRRAHLCDERTFHQHPGTRIGQQGNKPVALPF